MCFAYAGGSAWIFRTWAKQLPNTIELCAIELPGRGKRIAEPALKQVSSIVENLGPELLPYLNVPFACFGHSLGALVAFELCRWLRYTTQLNPYHFWVSAAQAPHLPATVSPMHTLPETEFINELKRYKGTPTSILNNAEMMALVLPTLRADFTVLETYHYQPSEPLNCPITGFWGQQDTIISQSEVAAWHIHTQDFSLKAIDGDHFFMQQPSFIKRLLPQLTL
ncbi:microcystin synthetase-associated thioesterase [Leptolyngbya sp. Heron Island J]|nr:microcystin synthetase-associated thioesterase [Leptolyngbya sp. Heron Island J]